MNTQYNWTTVGVEFVGEEKHEYEGEHSWTKDQILKAIEKIEWFDASIPQELPAIPGMAIQDTVEQLQIPRVQRIGHCSELAPYGLIGITGQYKDGLADIYAIDNGCKITPVLSVFTPKEV